MLDTPHQARARVASSKRWHGPDSPQTRDARRDLAAANLAAYIRKTVDTAPPFTPEMADELVLLLRGGTASTGDPARRQRAARAAEAATIRDAREGGAA